MFSNKLQNVDLELCQISKPEQINGSNNTKTDQNEVASGTARNDKGEPFQFRQDCKDTFLILSDNLPKNNLNPGVFALQTLGSPPDLGPPPIRCFENDGFGRSCSFNSHPDRENYIFKLLGAIALGMGFSLAMVVVLILCDDVMDFMKGFAGLALWVIFLVLYIVIMGIFCCCIGELLQNPILCCCGFLITVFFQTLSCMILAAHLKDPRVVLFLILTVMLILLVSSISTAITDLDITDCGNILCYVTMYLIILGIVEGVALCVFHVDVIWITVICGLVLIFILYMMYEIQLIVGGRHVELSPDMVFLGGLFFYTDIILILQFLIEMVLTCCDED